MAMLDECVCVTEYIQSVQNGEKLVNSDFWMGKKKSVADVNIFPPKAAKWLIFQRSNHGWRDEVVLTHHGFWGGIWTEPPIQRKGIGVLLSSS